MRGLKYLAIAFVVAAGAFWTTMLTTPPKSVAGPTAGLDTKQLTLEAHSGMGQQYDAF